MSQTTAKLKRPMGAYFLFAADVRATTRKENPEAKMTEIGKMIGAKWKEMTDEQKQVYKDRAAADKARYEKLVAEAKAAGTWVEPASKAKGGSTGLPLARVRKITRLDPDVKNMSKEALLLITKATELFVEHFARTAAKKSAGTSIKMGSLNRCVHHTEQFEFLQQDFEQPNSSGQVRPAKKAKTRGGDAASRVPGNENANPISQYFSMAAAAGE